MSALLPQVLVNGLIVGAVYGLMGLSLTMIYGAMRMANLAHGDVVVMGSFVAFVVTNQLGFPPAVSLALAFLLVGGIGAALFFVAGKRLQRSNDPELASFLFFYGVSLMIAAALLFLFDADTRSVRYQFQPISFRVAGLFLPHARIFALAVGLSVVAVFFVFLYRTIYGKALRAAIMNRSALAVVGVDVDRLSLIAFAASLGLAGATGVLMALIFPAFHPFSGLDYTIVGFIVIVLGGLGHPAGAILGGVIFGVAEQVTALYLGQSVGLIMGFLLLVAVVVARPRGLLGRAEWRG